MDRKKLTAESTLIQYILGELDRETTLRVEELLEEDHTLVERLMALEDQFEMIGRENAVHPPDSVKETLIQALESGNTESIGPVKKNSVKVLPWQTASWRIAAGIVLIFGLASAWLFTQWQSTRSDLEALRDQSAQLTERLNMLEQEFTQVNLKYGQVNHPDVIPFVLVGNDQLPDAKIVAYMNHKARSVVVNTAALPDLKNTQSYQLWADVAGEMINMGVLESGEELIPVKYIDRAESLNVTVEPYGGSDHPTVANLISYVKL